MRNGREEKTNVHFSFSFNSKWIECGVDAVAAFNCNVQCICLIHRKPSKDILLAFDLKKKWQFELKTEKYSNTDSKMDTRLSKAIIIYLQYRPIQTTDKNKNGALSFLLVSDACDVNTSISACMGINKSMWALIQLWMKWNWMKLMKSYRIGPGQ